MEKNAVLVVLLLHALVLQLQLGSTRAQHLRRTNDANDINNVNVPKQRRLQGIDVSFSSNAFAVLDDDDDNHDNNDNNRDWRISSSEASPVIPEDVEMMTGGPFVGPEVNVDHENLNDDMIITDRIVGGYDAEPHSFHSMLLIRYGGGWRWAGCGATLVSNCHVVTAAHCVADPTKPPGAVFVNAHTPYQNNGNVPFHFSPVAQVIRHAGFNDTTNANDVAVLKMSQCLNTTEFPPAVPANPQMTINATSAVPANPQMAINATSNATSDDLVTEILGFGKLSETSSLFVNVESLQMAQVPMIPRESCLEYYGDKIKNDMYCAGFAGGGIDACQGDSGSSMTFVDAEQGNTVLLGVISWGVGCGRSQSPGVYASVQYHFDWLARQICPDPDTTVDWCNGYTTLPTPVPSLAPSLSPVAPSTPAPSIAATTAVAPTSNKADTPQTNPSLSSQKNSGKNQEAQQRSSELYSTSVVLEDPSSSSSQATSTSTTVSHADVADPLTFWDSGCKTSGHVCWVGHECCSGICRNVGGDASSCISAGLVAGMRRKGKAKGERLIIKDTTTKHHSGE